MFWKWHPKHDEDEMQMQDFILGVVYFHSNHDAQASDYKVSEYLTLNVLLGTTNMHFMRSLCPNLHQTFSWFITIPWLQTTTNTYVDGQTIHTTWKKWQLVPADLDIPAGHFLCWCIYSTLPWKSSKLKWESTMRKYASWRNRSWNSHL